MSINIFDRDLLRIRRTRHSATASDYDFLLKRATEDIKDRLVAISRDFTNVLDLGAHHGILGRALLQRGDVKTLVSLEDCPQLLNQCEGIKVLSDMEFLPLAPQRYELITSALSLHFINDLPGLLLQVRQLLKPDGLFIAVFPGGRSFYELRDAFTTAEEELEGGASPRISPYVDVREAGALLQRAGYTLPVSDVDTLTISYETPFHLLKELQSMGASNILLERSRKPLRRATLMRMAEIYTQKYADNTGRINATLELVTITGWSPHESQQKPLRPGTATTRLAEALGTHEKSAGEKAGQS